MSTEIADFSERFRKTTFKYRKNTVQPIVEYTANKGKLPATFTMYFRTL